MLIASGNLFAGFFGAGGMEIALYFSFLLY